MWLWLPWVVLVVVVVLGLIVTMGYGRGYVGGGLIFFFFFLLVVSCGHMKVVAG